MVVFEAKKLVFNLLQVKSLLTSLKQEVLSPETALDCSEFEQLLLFSASLTPPSVQSTFALPLFLLEVEIPSDKVSLM